MKDINMKIELHCLFCESTNFEIPYEGYQPQNGELVTCGNCGRKNDYSSLITVAVEKGKKMMAKEVTEQIKKSFKGSNIKLK